MTLTKSLDSVLNMVRKVHSADSNEQIGRVTKNFTTANFEYIGPQFTVHLNVNFRFCKETPLPFKVSRGKKFCYLSFCSLLSAKGNIHTLQHCQDFRRTSFRSPITLH